MAGNYVLLERIELNASAASVVFSNIPQTGYTDLKIVMSARATVSGVQNVKVAFNGATTAYSYKLLYGTGAAAGSSSGADNVSVLLEGTDYTSNTFGNGEIYIPNYTSSNYKSYSSDSITENNATASYVEMFAHLWSNTSAISSIAITPVSGSFATNSTFSLYGIANASTTPVIAPKADGGNVITTDGTYWYHTFLSNGTFTPSLNLSCDILMVAGGGSAGLSYGGGGGGGGVQKLTSQPLTAASNYSVGIGAGAVGTTGAGGNNRGPGLQGSNTSFTGMSDSVGGGAGGWFVSGSGGANGGNGGSGGGAANALQGYGTGGTATSGQGYNGGGTDNSQSSTGAGGGAGSAGGSGTSGLGGTAGNGTQWYTAYSATYYGGGGAGAPSGSGGSQGGTAAAGNGVINTGAGGGAESNGIGAASTTGKGGSGIVIVRYLVA